MWCISTTQNCLALCFCYQKISLLLTINMHGRLESNNFRWLNAVKETKIEFFVRDNSGEKFLTAHAARRNFSEVICRACAVVVHSWFSHLHGKFCVLALRTFPTRPAPFELRIWLVGTVGSQRPVLILVFPGCMCRFSPSAGRARRL